MLMFPPLPFIQKLQKGTKAPEKVNLRGNKDTDKDRGIALACEEWGSGSLSHQNWASEF